MKHRNTLDAGSAALIVVDVQEAFRRAVPDPDDFIGRVVALVRGCSILGLPVIVTEQYPKGLGRTVSEVLEALPETARLIEKTAFSSCGADDFVRALGSEKVRQAVVCGLETHICVNQTVHDLLARSFEVHVVEDAVASRTEANRQTGLRKMTASGAVPSSVEMALFELMRDSRHADFKAIQNLVK